MSHAAAKAAFAAKWLPRQPEAQRQEFMRDLLALVEALARPETP